MRFANVAGRAALVSGDEFADIESVSDGLLPSDPMACLARWDELVRFAPTVSSTTGPLMATELRCPVPAPRQVFAIGLNYRSHAEEAGMAVPATPIVFTKFPACLAGPFDDVEIMGERVDWEVELVVVMGRRADRVRRDDAWEHVAGLTVGQDISDRELQFGEGGQFSMGKSWRGFGPMGPWVVTPDEVDDPDDLALGCSVDGAVVQDDRTSGLVFDVATLVESLSAVVPLLPGDVVFTGTPGGVGFSRDPARSLRPGDVLESWIEGIGTIRNRCVAPT
jgi:2-keto-4-pentenoate hydratase/2-oxohepta-3-ene-1,7-dioic acid hydratase in catechol pathway